MRCINLIRLGLMSFALFSCGQEQTRGSTGTDRFSAEIDVSYSRNVDVPVTILKESQKAVQSPQQWNSHDPYH